MKDFALLLAVVNRLRTSEALESAGSLEPLIQLQIESFLLIIRAARYTKAAKEKARLE